MVASWRPDLAFQVAFNADPNDAYAVPSWTDLSSRFRHAQAVARGGQYELNQTQAGQPPVVLDDPDEYLNPANTASPYYPNVVPYRQCLFQAMWNNQSTGNLLNTGYGANTVLGTTSAGYDPSFESYSNGATVAWITAVGGTSPTVTTTNPQQGTKDLTYTVASSTTVQGAQLAIPAIPGRQYTDSLYVRQSSASTQQIGVGGLTSVVDAFGRTASSGWGTADTGGAWTTSGGVASDYSVSGGVGVHALNTVATSRKTVVSSSILDADTYVTATTPVVATGATIDMQVMARWQDASNYYMLGARLNTDSTVTAFVGKNIAGVVSTVGSATVSGLTYAAGTSLRIRAQVSRTTLQVKVWNPSTDSEPSSWSVSATDTSLSAAGSVGCRSLLNTGNTNTTPVSITLDSFQTVATVVGTSTTTTGSYVRLTVTYTASQPTQTLQLVTIGSASAGTSNVDAVQHEQGASANTFTTSGPVIYGVFRGYVERWPAAWDAAGFRGRAEITCVDAFGPLNKTTLWTEYRNAVLAKTPDYYWPLNEPDGSTTFAEASGNNGPPLLRLDNPGGPTGTYSPGTTTDISGDPSGTGLQMLGQSAGWPAAGTCLTTYANAPSGIAGGGPPKAIVSIGSNTSTWGVTFAFWFFCPDGSIDATGTIGGHYGPLVLAYNTSVDVAWPAIGLLPDGLTVGALDLSVQGDGGVGADATTTATYNNQTQVHLFVAVVNQTGGNQTLTLYVDNVVKATTTVGVIAAYSTATPDLRCNRFVVLGDPDRFGGTGPNGTIAHVAAWNRALSSTEVTDLWTAGQGYPGETSGARVARYLGYSYAGGATSVATGMSTMGASDLSAGTTALAACQGVTATEVGNFWASVNVAAAGAATFKGRDARYLTTTSTYVFGESVSGGEYPYQDGIGFDFDPTFIYNDVTISQLGGVNAHVGDSASVAKFFANSYSLTVNCEDPNEAIDHATYILAQYKQPRQRVASVILDPSSYPTLWPVVLGLEIGVRVTVKRRATGGSLVMSGEYFVESISHDVDMDGGTWLTVLLLSPVDLYQVGILDDATYGLLDSSLILAF